MVTITTVFSIADVHVSLGKFGIIFFCSCTRVEGKMYPSDELKANWVNGQSTDKRSLVHSQAHGEYHLITVRSNRDINSHQLL